MASDRTSIKEAYRLFDVIANGRRLLTEEERKRFHEHVRSIGIHQSSHVELTRPLQQLSPNELGKWLKLAAKYDHHALFHYTLQVLKHRDRDRDRINAALLQRCLYQPESFTYSPTAEWKANHIAILSDIIRLQDEGYDLSECADVLSLCIGSCLQRGIDLSRIDKDIVSLWFDIAFRSSAYGPELYQNTLRQLMGSVPSVDEGSIHTVSLHRCFDLLLAEQDLPVTKEVFQSALARCCEHPLFRSPPDAWYFNRLLAERNDDFFRLDFQNDILAFVKTHLACDREEKTALLRQLRNLHSFPEVTGRLNKKRYATDEAYRRGENDVSRVFGDPLVVDLIGQFAKGVTPHHTKKNKKEEEEEAEEAERGGRRTRKRKRLRKRRR